MMNDSCQQSVLQVRLPDGAALPVIDVTNPAFRINDAESNLSEWRTAIAAPINSNARQQNIAPDVTAIESMPDLLKRMFSRSTGYLDGWATYLLKAGVENLPSIGTEIERRLLSSPNAMSLRVRLQQLSHIMAEALKNGLDAPSLRLITIGGGTAIEALNALILLKKNNGQGALPAIEIALLDIEDEGSDFSGAALRALQAPDGCLAGVSASITFYPYSWMEPDSFKTRLQGWAAEGGFMLASSEGALFEYGSDEVILSNLRLLREAGSVPVAGSVIRDDAAGQAMVERSPFTLYARGIAGIETLANATGYRVTRVTEGVATDQFLLEAG